MYQLNLMLLHPDHSVTYNPDHYGCKKVKVHEALGHGTHLYNMFD